MDLGIIDYNEAYKKQQEHVKNVQQTGKTVLLCCEHPPVITFGRMSKQEHLLVPDEELKARNVTCVEIDRGGDITLHAPGQLVIYPILDLKKYKQDLHWYLNQLEEITIRTLKEFGIEAHCLHGKTGVYTNRKKITSMGIGVKKWVTYHGVGINVSTDLNLFSLIKPCGLDVSMTSMENELDRVISMEEVKEKWIQHFKGVFHG